jgi:hypothetical protein
VFSVLHPETGKGADSGALADLQRRVREVIQRTLPKKEGKHRRKVFRLARGLKTLFPDANPLAMEPYVRQWHGQARPFLEEKTFTDTHVSFLEAWDKVKTVEGDGLVEKLFREALKRPFPKEAGPFDRVQVKQLVALCAALQAHAGRVSFFLDCRKAGRLLGVRHETAWRWLRHLERMGVLRRESTGNLEDHTANEYWFLPGER